MITPNEYRAMLEEAREENQMLRDRLADVTVQLAGAQSDSRYKDRLLAQKEVEICALTNKLRAAEGMGRGFKT